MPDDRFFHKRAGHSDKVNSLTDFEELVWRYYILSADDFGVMKFSPDQLRADHERAAGKSVKVVQRALDRIVAIGLVHRFDHQGRQYIYSRNWQEYQKVDYPRETIAPMPPAEELAACKPETLNLFGFHPGGKFGREMKKLIAEGLSIDSARVRLLVPEGGPGETAAPRPSRGIGSGVMAGSLPRDHVRHAFCGRKCVPDFLHGEFKQSVGGADPDATVRLFYAEVMASIPADQPIGEEPLKFWRGAVRGAVRDCRASREDGRKYGGGGAVCRPGESMTDQDREAFAVLMLGLGETYGEQVSEARMEIYFAALADLTLDAVREASTAHVQAVKFFPRPAEIREAVAGSTDDRAALAWNALLQLVRRVGYPGTDGRGKAPTFR
jgi:hypothetical protein